MPSLGISSQLCGIGLWRAMWCFSVPRAHQPFAIGSVEMVQERQCGKAVGFVGFSSCWRLERRVRLKLSNCYRDDSSELQQRIAMGRDPMFAGDDREFLQEDKAELKPLSTEQQGTEENLRVESRMQSHKDAEGGLNEQLLDTKENTSLQMAEQFLKRSDIIAKQVITVSDALSVGYVSQLWVDARKWQVKALELKPSLLFGEVEGVFLSSLLKVGDVVLVKDEEELQGDLRLPSFDTIIGFELVTEDGNHLGKVRDYVFNLHGGDITYIEFDSLGVSLIPANMITTYCLRIDDIVESTADALLVKSGAEDRMRRLTKGLLNFPQKVTERKQSIPRRQRRNPSSIQESPPPPSYKRRTRQRSPYYYEAKEDLVQEEQQSQFDGTMKSRSRHNYLQYSPNELKRKD